MGVLIEPASVSLIMDPEAQQGLGMNALIQMAVLGATVCYLFTAIYGRRFRRLGVNPNRYRHRAVKCAGDHVAAVSACDEPSLLLSWRNT
jgi:hypothetical protein